MPDFRFQTQVISCGICVCLTSLSVRISSSNRVAANALISFYFMADSPLCVYLLRLCFGGNILRCRPPTSPVLPPEAPGEGPSCLCQLLGAPGGPGLVATSLPSLSLSQVASLLCLGLLSLRKTLSWDGGPPSSRRTSSQTLPMASPVCLLC